MSDAALKLLASKPLRPTAPKPPVKPVFTGQNQHVSTPERPETIQTGATGNVQSLDDTDSRFAGLAPSPEQEITVQPEPTLPTPPTDETGETSGARFKRLLLASASNDNPVKYIDADTDNGTVTVSASVDEETFIQFWSQDAYEIVSGLFGLFKIDMSEIETDEDEIEQGRKAAKHLWRASGRYKWLSWMRQEATINGGDLMLAMAFFAGKGMAVKTGLQNHKKKKIAAKNQVIEGEVKHV